MTLRRKNRKSCVIAITLLICDAALALLLLSAKTPHAAHAITRYAIFIIDVADEMSQPPSPSLLPRYIDAAARARAPRQPVSLRASRRPAAHRHAAAAARACCRAATSSPAPPRRRLAAAQARRAAAESRAAPRAPAAARFHTRVFTPFFITPLLYAMLPFLLSIARPPRRQPALPHAAPCARAAPPRRSKSASGTTQLKASQPRQASHDTPRLLFVFQPLIHAVDALARGAFIIMSAAAPPFITIRAAPHR